MKFRKSALKRFTVAYNNAFRIMRGLSMKLSHGLLPIWINAESSAMFILDTSEFHTVWFRAVYSISRAADIISVFSVVLFLTSCV